MAHTRSIAVRGFHCDAYGHVNNGRYLEFLEDARWDGLVKEGLLEKFDVLGLQFFVVNIDISFKRPVAAGDEIVVETSLEEVKRKTISFLQRISIGTEITTVAVVTFVMYDKEKHRAASISPEIESLFSSFRNDKS